MAFSWQTRYYPTLHDYQTALFPFAVPAWVAGVTIHHTWKPTADQWRGRRTMDTLERFYRAKGWSGGPHLFLAPDGIWAGTPLATPGVHAGACNKDHVGLEIVGDFDHAPWPAGLRERIYALIVTLCHWAGLTERQVHGHRECLNNKSCPGAAIALDMVRRDLGERLFDQRFVVTVAAARVRLFARTTSAIVASVPLGTPLSAHPVKGETFQGSNRWARVKLPSGAMGHIWAGLGRFEPV